MQRTPANKQVMPWSGREVERTRVRLVELQFACGLEVATLPD
ncbi:hypothetical protein [uncultured Nostoc sp.]|nr:hypothetical protein [uncultured Nostoc sp.]